MKTLPDQETLQELLELAKNYEQQARKLYQKSEVFAQKWEIGLKNKQKQDNNC
jgi:hypothetical protein